MKKAIFWDRDGVLNLCEVREGKPYAPRRVEDFEVFPEAVDVLTELKKKGFFQVVVTNQPDVGNGFVQQEVVGKMHQRLREALPVDDVKVCYASQKEGSPMRKPSPGMLLQTATEYGIDLKESFMVGDRWSDVEAGKSAGCKTIFLDRGYGEKRPKNPDFVVQSLEEVLGIIQ